MASEFAANASIADSLANRIESLGFSVGPDEPTAQPDGGLRVHSVSVSLSTPGETSTVGLDTEQAVSQRRLTA